MSYILEALKKTEQERARGQVPALTAVQSVAAPAPARSRLWVLLVAVAVAGAAGGVLIARQAGSGPQAPVAVSASGMQPVAKAEAPAARDEAGRVRAYRATPASPPVAGPPDRGGADSRSPASSGPKAPQATPTGPPASTATPATATSPAQGESRARRLANSPGATAPDTASTASPARDSAPKATASIPRAAPIQPQSPSPPAPAKPPPLLADLPAAEQSAIPPLHMDVHVYAREAGRRFVLINMKKYREGDTLASGPRLRRITPDGVVLSYHGVRFRLARE